MKSLFAFLFAVTALTLVIWKWHQPAQVEQPVSVAEQNVQPFMKGAPAPLASLMIVTPTNQLMGVFSMLDATHAMIGSKAGVTLYTIEPNGKTSVMMGAPVSTKALIDLFNRSIVHLKADPREDAPPQDDHQAEPMEQQDDEGMTKVHFLKVDARSPPDAVFNMPHPNERAIVIPQRAGTTTHYLPDGGITVTYPSRHCEKGGCDAQGHLPPINVKKKNPCGNRLAEYVPATGIFLMCRSALVSSAAH